MSEIAEYQQRRDTIVALHYDGEFPLDFLERGEEVGNSGDGTGACLVTGEGWSVLCPLGGYLVRSGGALRYIPAERFRDLYDRVI